MSSRVVWTLPATPCTTHPGKQNRSSDSRPVSAAFVVNGWFRSWHIPDTAAAARDKAEYGMISREETDGMYHGDECMFWYRIL